MEAELARKDRTPPTIALIYFVLHDRYCEQLRATQSQYKIILKEESGRFIFQQHPLKTVERLRVCILSQSCGLEKVSASRPGVQILKLFI